MPDWTYQTLFRPLLFRLPAKTAREMAFGGIGRLGRLPGGKQVIAFMGHMPVDSRLAVDRAGLSATTRVGLSCRFDPHLSATAGVAEFGLGVIEIGPIVAAQPKLSAAMTLEIEEEAIRLPSPTESLSVADAVRGLQRNGPLRQPLLARIEPETSDQAAEMCHALDQYVAGWVVPLEGLPHLSAMNQSGEGKVVLAAVCAGQWNDVALQEQIQAAIHAGTIHGLVIETSMIADGSRTLGKPEYAAALETVVQLRTALGCEPIVMMTVGIHSPADALDALEAGADWVLLDSGLAFAGPGLPKRINEALLYLHLQREGARAKETNSSAGHSQQESHLGGQAWLWAMLMGLAMFVGGILAMIIATTYVVLPYDEAMAGLTREQLLEINDRLLDFMTHDRVTLSGTMLSVGILYMALAWCGIRRGLHWAWMTVIASAFAGFFSFFSFLGFGYFDPFHAFVTAVMFQFLLLTVHSRSPARHGMEPPDLHNDRSWMLNQWGQLLFVIHGAVLIAAGCVISGVGMTTVFVEEDLDFMDTCAATLLEAHPRLVPLVAHDRATFGGMLVATGVATLLASLWGFRRGQAWLWWALLLAGNVAYVATIAVHWTVGYLSLEHLLPAYGGLALLWAGLALSYSYLAASSEALEREWIDRLSRRA